MGGTNSDNRADVDANVFNDHVLAKWTTENLSTNPMDKCGTCFSVRVEIFSLEYPVDVKKICLK